MSVRALSEKRQMEVIDIDHIECAINQVLYPALMELVLRKPQLLIKCWERIVSR